MAFDGNGNFIRVYNWTNDAANGIDITASRVDTEDTGFASGLSLCVTRDGQGKMAADLVPTANNTYALGTASFTWTQILATCFQSTKTATQAWGPTAAALVDLTPDTGTFTMTYTGFTGSPSGTATWVRVGKLITIMIPAATGTSNSTQWQATGVPAALQPPTLPQTFGIPGDFVEDSSAFLGVTALAEVTVTAASGTWVFKKNNTAVNWTGSGLKGLATAYIFSYLLL